MKRAEISKLFRALGLIYFADWVRFYVEKKKNKRRNRRFKREHPDAVLPPDYLMYESFQVDYKKYYTDSIETAKWLTDHFKKHISLDNVKVLDWGCGPGRIIRHLPDIIGEDCKYYGTDYNKESIKWCKDSIKRVEFNLNTIEAKLPYVDNKMDIIYSISILTHLSEKMHFDWIKELSRVLRSGGIMFITTQGENFKSKMTDEELEDFNAGKLVVRGKVKEGHRTYSAFHPKEFMTRLFADVEVLEHIEIVHEKGKMPPQDIWIIKKK